ncbi:MAG: hydrogenase maturation protease [Solirubrobacteraceae bacterium]|jgi:hydrogenase maturation protease|nr:hydrogenase maturation protease [Solirubrobacteraceae bacterium]
MSVDPGGWEALERPGPDMVLVEGVEVRRGSRVRLAPRPGGDVFDLALAGRSAIVDAIESDLDGGLLIAVTVDDDPGRDLGEDRQPGHRFFFSAGEIEPLPDAPSEATDAEVARVLVAGIGNVFLADDGFGVAVADRLGRGRLPAGVDVVDYGIRGMDLAYALAEYDFAILVDVAPRGGSPGTLYVIEADLEESGVVPEAHGMDPVKVLALARELGPLPAKVLVVACEPRLVMTGEEEDIVVELSEPVRAAVEPAARLVLRLLEEHRPNAIRQTEEP